MFSAQMTGIGLVMLTGRLILARVLCKNGRKGE